MKRIIVLLFVLLFINIYALDKIPKNDIKLSTSDVYYVVYFDLNYKDNINKNFDDVFNVCLYSNWTYTKNEIIGMFRIPVKYEYLFLIKINQKKYKKIVKLGSFRPTPTVTPKLN